MVEILSYHQTRAPNSHDQEMLEKVEKFVSLNPMYGPSVIFQGKDILKLW